MLSHMVGFLHPCDFYNLKTVVSSGLCEMQRDQINCYYWWREEVALTRAVEAACPSLVRWVIQNDEALSPDEVDMAATFATTQSTAVAVHTATRRFPELRPRLLECWIERGNTAMFTWQIARERQITVDAFDTIYLHSRWLILAKAFHYCPHEFVRWAFGGFIDVADHEVVTNLRFVLHYLGAPDQLVLIRILNKYHDWLWRTKIDRTATIQTITALHGLAVSGVNVVPFHPERHLTQALASPQHTFLEYLLLRGLEVEPDMLRRTHDLKKLQLLMTAQVVQKYQKIMLMLLVLIIAVVLNIWQSRTRPANTVSTAKIETRVA
jgi:hypothetical protein